VGHALDRFGALHILVNNVWGSKEPDGSAEDLTESGWDYAMEVGLKSIFRAAKHAVPHIRASGGGSIVNIASVHGLLMAPGKLAYETGELMNMKVEAMTARVKLEMKISHFIPFLSNSSWLSQSSL